MHRPPLPRTATTHHYRTTIAAFTAHHQYASAGVAGVPAAPAVAAVAAVAVAVVALPQPAGLLKYCNTRVGTAGTAPQHRPATSLQMQLLPGQSRARSGRTE
eukprot:CAMPEP_0181180472 /NCGR_PEP_ID=MMETSP1096-20121128/6821_1 /TAXON_ID=156174 ORGANISM="Chrysochromulina ericina, Strain CCMP281" /NCGR_SAMPLE_ID=MMETSP1096 /ASSEMBLY_ACC=CAM_ASM_000453 /LENGTH=101 /DNA_ID=CAMNT_0023268909 /DNA_START=276 /DNA_END=582 /DNA_ORIENTATION=+